MNDSFVNFKVKFFNFVNNNKQMFVVVHHLSDSSGLNDSHHLLFVKMKLNKKIFNYFYLIWRNLVIESCKGNF